MRLSRLLSAAAVALILGANAACSDSTGADSGRLSLKLTDAPGDFRKAVVTIERIYLQGSDDDEGDGTRVILLDTPRTIDLLTLADSVDDLVTDAIVPSGTYHQLRFVISGAYIEVEQADGSTRIFATSGYEAVPAGVAVTGDLQTPSFASSGLKVKLPGDRIRIDGDQKVLLVDFDVSRSFGHAAGGDKWVMHPVVEATEFVASGTLDLTVARADTVEFPLINGTRVSLAGYRAVLSTALGAREVRDLTDADGDGVFESRFRFVAPGTYALDLEAPSDSVIFTTDPARPLAVTIGSGTVNARAFTITSARK